MLTFLRFTLLVICFFGLYACGGSSGGVAQDHPDGNGNDQEHTFPECPPGPDLSYVEITGFTVTVLMQMMVAYADSPTGYFHSISFTLYADYTDPTSDQAKRWRFQLFPSAQAASCLGPELPVTIVSLSITSDRDLYEDYPTGDSLNSFFSYSTEMFPLTTDGKNIDMHIYSPPLDLEHTFTLEIELDNGDTHIVTLGPITFPEKFPSQTEFRTDVVEPPQTSTGLLNDTGVDWCTDLTENLLECPIAGLPLQDGEVGRDALASRNQLAKSGGGAAGFDFTKLDSQGHALAADAGEWHCVRDNHTGLIWEVKTSSGLRSSANSYTWYNPDDSVNGGTPGIADGGNCTESPCDTYGYVQAINALELCGLSNWRLPNHNELLSLVHYHRAEPSIDTGYFPNTQGTRYWHSSLSAPSEIYDWRTQPFPGIVSFHSGGLNAFHYQNSVAARLVSGSAEASVMDASHCSSNLLTPTTPSADFVMLEDDAVVRHLATNLEWRRCSLGQEWDGSGCAGPAKVFTLRQAFDQLYDHPGWRLPNIKELSSIIELCRAHPAINPVVFPNTPSVDQRWSSPINYWSATPANHGRVLTVNFDLGHHDGGRLGRVRLVRDGLVQ